MYEVPDMQLIPQDGSNACWYASALMVLQWSRRGERMSLPGASLINPAAHPSIDSTHQVNDGLHWAQMRSFARQLGLREMPLATPSPQEFERWFREYGPV